MKSIRAAARHTILSLIGSIKKPAPGIHILNGHIVAPENANMQIFIKQLSLLQKAGVRLISFEDAVRKIMQHETPNEPLVAFTFDDGFEEHATMIAPALEHFGINAAFFINPEFIDGDHEYISKFCSAIVKTPPRRPMTWEMIQNLKAKGHTIGAHTMSHYLINSTDLKKLEYEIGECKKAIKERLKECEHFAIPFGRMDCISPEALEIARKHYKHIYLQDNYKKYFSFNNQVINRRHFEPYWPIEHIIYFISKKKTYSS